MRVFVTGATGHLGSALVPELQRHGHQAVGLARSDASAARLAGWGAEVVRGDLDDLDTLRAAADAADGVVHLAFRHDAMEAGDLTGAADSDLAAVRAIADVLAGTGKPFLGTSGTGLLAGAGLDRPGTEDDTLPGGYRIDAENLVVDLAAKQIRSSVVRLPIVHGPLDTGFIRSLIGFARRNGFSAYVGSGTNRWSSVHTLDAARLYRLALESAPAGARLHAVHDGGVEFRQIAEALGRGLGLPARSISKDQAPEYVGYLAHFVTIDNPTTATRTRELLDWEPTEIGLLEDLAQSHYFG
ncbi:SDR family oxidoreductase [Kribbella sp. NPDC051770]|uniref:SDR family oxidoreductase n=1 Tax=Kribbella sp. NPDC051770 TaxID=3155413 RepID=UPI0034147400